MICGVDEAGKGSVLGPLVIAGVCCASDTECAAIGARDSKLLSPERRRCIAEEIGRRFRTSVVVFTPDEIDRAMERMTLNELVARGQAEVLRALRPDTAFLDACDVNEERFRETVRRHLDFGCRLVSEHGADRRYPVVGAASILAKVRRDLAIEELSRIYGELGSGYPSDPVTRAYLERYIREHRAPPPFARRRWKTVTRLLGQLEQSRLGCG